MSSTIAADSPATGLEPEPDFPPDFNPDLHPILAVHWFGLDPQELLDVRQTWWGLARQGYPPTAEPGVILLAGGRS